MISPFAPPPPRKDFWLRHCRLYVRPLRRRLRGRVSVERERPVACRLGELAATQYRKSRARSLKAAASRRYFTFFPLPPKWELFFVTRPPRITDAAGRLGGESDADSDVLRLAAGVRGRTLRTYACVHTSVALHVIFQTCVCTCRYLSRSRSHVKAQKHHEHVCAGEGISH